MGHKQDIMSKHILIWLQPFKPLSEKKQKKQVFWSNMLRQALKTWSFRIKNSFNKEYNHNLIEMKSPKQNTLKIACSIGINLKLEIHNMFENSIDM